VPPPTGMVVVGVVVTLVVTDDGGVPMIAGVQTKFDLNLVTLRVP